MDGVRLHCKVIALVIFETMSCLFYVDHAFPSAYKKPAIDLANLDTPPPYENVPSVNSAMQDVTIDMNRIALNESALFGSFL